MKTALPSPKNEENQTKKTNNERNSWYALPGIEDDTTDYDSDDPESAPNREMVRDSSPHILTSISSQVLSTMTLLSKCNIYYYR